MSWWATAYVGGLTHCPNGEGLTRDEKLLLMVLADHHDPAQNAAYPGLPRLAQLALMSKRHAVDVLASLERKGVLAIKRGCGAGNRSDYVFVEMPEQASRKGAPHAPFLPQKNLPAKVQKRCTAEQQMVQKGCTGGQRNKEVEPAEPQEPTEPQQQYASASEANQLLSLLREKLPGMTRAAAQKFLECARKQMADVAVAEVAEVVVKEAATLGHNVRNPVGVLLSWVREYFSAEDVMAVRDLRGEFERWIDGWAREHPGEDGVDLVSIPARYRALAERQMESENGKRA